MKLGKTGESVPVIGYGTWRLGGGWWRPDRSKDLDAIKAIAHAVEEGSTFVDTAEAYGGGHTEELVGRALESLEASIRGKVFIATKVDKEHLSSDQVVRSCEGSLRRLGVRQIDLLQIHWPNPSVPISDTMKAFEQLVDIGKVRYIGVSNFTSKQVEAAQSEMHRHEIQSNQVSYSMADRSPEADVLPYCKRNGLTVIAYSPLARGELPTIFKSLPALEELSRRKGVTASQLALCWLSAKGNVLSIPKAAKLEHIDENIAAGDLQLNQDEVELIDRALNQRSSKL